MAIAAQVFVRLSFVPDGAGPMSQPSAQSIEIGYAGPQASGGSTIPLQIMPGGNTVNSTNLNTLGTNIGSAVQTALAAVQSTIAGWPTGGQ